ncbi:MAG: hypothetical protein JST00_30810 [Deltaproteobacteria bacterium]|nr:hypothetical protein [Deltaproteobacteria bacterium]
MSPRLAVALALALVAFVACKKEGAPGSTTSQNARASKIPAPPAGPCATDADCKLYLEPCSCACLAHVGEAPRISNADWSTVCGGGPPGNCGVASPCGTSTAACDAATKTCVVKR